MSAVRSDFQQIFWGRRVKVQGAGSENFGFLARFKDNNFGASMGVYFSALPVNRLWSLGLLEDAGWSWRHGRNAEKKLVRGSGESIEVERADNVYWVKASFVAESSVAENAQESVIKYDAELGCMVTKLDDLELHRRACHLHIPGVDAEDCGECEAAKAKRNGHGTSRPENLRPTGPLQVLAVDYVGPVEIMSVDKMTIMLTVIDQFSKSLWIIPLSKRSDGPAKIVELISALRARYGKGKDEVAIVSRIRLDNDSCFKADATLKLFVESSAYPMFTSTYSPWANGCVERVNRVVGEFIKTACILTDQRLWSFAVRQLAFVWNRVPRRHRIKSLSGLSPSEVRREYLRLVGEFGERWHEHVDAKHVSSIER